MRIAMCQRPEQAVEIIRGGRERERERERELDCEPHQRKCIISKTSRSRKLESKQQPINSPPNLIACLALLVAQDSKSLHKVELELIDAKIIEDGSPARQEEFERAWCFSADVMWCSSGRATQHAPPKLVTVGVMLLILTERRMLTALVISAQEIEGNG
jgi:hypothetical protein